MPLMVLFEPMFARFDVSLRGCEGSGIPLLREAIQVGPISPVKQPVFYPYNLSSTP
jgi:hypothetical protein